MNNVFVLTLLPVRYYYREQLQLR